MRTFAAVVIGYLAIAVVVFGGLSLAYLALGPELAFRPRSFAVSPLWIAVNFAISFGAAVVGGRVARGIGRSITAVHVLAALVLVLGLFLALIGAPETLGPRENTLGAMDAMRQAQTPLWIMVLTPIIGALGVLLGGGALGRRGASPTA